MSDDRTYTLIEVTAPPVAGEIRYMRRHAAAPPSPKRPGAPGVVELPAQRVV